MVVEHRDEPSATRPPAPITSSLRISQPIESRAGTWALFATVRQLQSELGRVEQERQRALAEARKLQRQMQAAARVQRGSTPRRVAINGLDVDVLYRPLEGLGGDVCAVERLSDLEVAVSLGDVSGHGISAAMMAPMLEQALAPRMHDGSRERACSVLEVMRRANYAMLAFERKDGLCATALHARYDAEKRRLTFARAGHPQAILLQPGAAPQVLEAEGLLLGALLDGNWAVRSVHLRPGDRVLLYTDGLLGLLAAESAGPGDAESLNRWLAARSRQSTEMLLAEIRERCDTASRTGAAADDVAVVVLTVRN